MDELFRFVALRSAQQADPSRVIELKLSPELRDRLGAKHGSPQAVSLLVSAARAFASSDRFVAKSSSLTLHRQLGAFNDKVGQEPAANLATLQRYIADIFNLKPAALVASPDFLKDQERIADTIGAAWLDPGELCELIEQLAQFARLMSLAERVAAGDVSLDVPGAIQDALGRILVLPDALVPAMILPTAAEPPSSGNQLSAGINSSLVPLMPSRADQIADAVAIDATIDALLSQPPQAYATAVNDKIIAYGAPLVLTPESIAALDPTARTVLQKFLLDVSGSPPADGKAWRSPSVPEGVQILELALSDALAAIPPVSLTTDLTVTNDATSNASSVPPRLPSPVCHPSTDATIQAVGIGDLLVVRQTLTRYEPEEISYVENVLKTEKKERTTVRTTTTDQTFVTETETTTEEERDLQSTERYDLKRETEATSKEDFSVKGGVAATYRYGTVLEIKANVDLASSTSKQDSTKIATDYGKDVTARSASKITQRVRQQQTLRTIEMFQETDVHGVDNTDG